MFSVEGLYWRDFEFGGRHRLEVGAEDVQPIEDAYEVTCSPADFAGVVTALFVPARAAFLRRLLTGDDLRTGPLGALALYGVTLLAAFGCFFTTLAFDFLSKLPIFFGKVDDIVQAIGIQYHYDSVSRGILDSRDVVYFLSVIAVFLAATVLSLGRRKW